jgi:hypothetical protein
MIIEDWILATLVVLFILACGWLYVIWQNTQRSEHQIRQVVSQQALIGTDVSARTLCHAVHYLYPSMHAGVDFVIKHDDPGKPPYIAEWNSTLDQPTDVQLKLALAKISDHGLLENYAIRRQAEYPSIGDQLDAAFKARHGDKTEQMEQDRKIQEIKDKYPKSSGECGTA